jgi:hypothetical protein
MSRTTITQAGAIVYRTKNMDIAHAAAFARCIEANNGRFTSVEIVEARTKEEAYFVTFRPVSPERQGDMYEQQWNVRKERAEQEGAEYIFWRDTDNPGTDWCFNPKSGETYQVSTFSCSCPDYVYRCEKAGLLCKHQQARTMQAEAGRLGATDKHTRTYADVVDGCVVRKNLLTGAIVEESIEYRRARMQSSINRDF